MKNLMNLGKTLNKNEQKEINGGGGIPNFCSVYPNITCPPGMSIYQCPQGGWNCN